MTDKIHGKKGGKGGGAAGGSEAKNTLQSQATARIVEIISHGECVGLADRSHPLRSIYFDGVAIESPTGTYNYRGVQMQERTGTPNQAPFAGFPAVEAISAVGLQVTTASPRTYSVTSANVDAVRVNIQIDSLAKQDDEGNIAGNTLQYRIERRPAAGAWSTALTVKLHEKCTSPQQLSYRIERPAGLSATDDWDVRVVRITADPVKLSDQSSFSFATATELTDSKITYADMGAVAMTIDSKQFGASIPIRAYDWAGMILDVPSNYTPPDYDDPNDQAKRTYTGLWDGTFKRAWTDNPAWILWGLLTDKDWGLGKTLYPEQIDKWALYRIAQYCDEFVPDGFGGFEPRYTLNTQITGAEEAYAILQSIASAFRGGVYWGSGMVTFVADMPSDPVKLVSPANVIGGEFNYQGAALKERHSVAKITWNDPSDQYKTAIEVVEDAEMLDRYGWRDISIVAFGCTSRGQAVRQGKWILDTEKSAVETVTYQASLDHADVRPGDIVSIHDPNYAGVRMAGRVVEIGANSATVDDAVEIESGKTYEVSFIRNDGYLTTRELTNTPGTTTTLTWASSLIEQPAVSSTVEILADSLPGQRGRIASVTSTSVTLNEGMVIDGSYAYTLTFNLADGTQVSRTINNPGTGEYRTLSWTSSLGTLPPVGSVTYLAVPLSGYTSRTVSARTHTSVTVSSGITIDNDHTYLIRLTLPSGTEITRKLTNAPGAGVTVLTWDADETTNALPLTSSMWGITASDLAPRQFRVIGVKELDPNLFEITGLLHDPNKYDRIELGLELDETPTSIYQSEQVPDTPTVIHAFRLPQLNQDGTYAERVMVSWAASVSPLVNRYRVRYMFRDQWYDAGETYSDNIDFISHGAGIYLIQVIAVNFMNKESIPLEESFDLEDVRPFDGPVITNVRIEDTADVAQASDVSFTGADLKLQWGATPPADWSNQDLTDWEDPHLRRYRIQLKTTADVVVGTFYTTERRFILTKEMNTEANGGTPLRQFKIGVAFEDHYGTVFTESVQQFSNPAPAAPTVTVTATAKGFTLDVSKCTETDYGGTKIWVSTTNGFDPTVVSPVVDAPQTSFSVAATTGTTYYVRAAHYDDYSAAAANLNRSAQYSITVPALGTVDIGVGVIGSDNLNTGETVNPPTALSVSSVLTLETDGTQRVMLTSSWTAPVSGTNVSFYEISITEGAGSAVVLPVTGTSYNVIVKANTAYAVKVRSVSFTGARSAYTTVSNHTSTRDTVAPAAPTSLSITPSLTALSLAWTNPSDTDLAHVELWENTTNATGGTKLTTLQATPSSGGSWTRAGLASGVTRYYSLRAVDTSGNISSYSSVASGTVSSITFDSIDTAAPAVPTGLALTSALSTNTDGTQLITLVATWSAVADSDLSFYELAIQEASGTFVEFTVGQGTRFERVVKANTSYTAKIRAVDETQNRSAFSSTVSHTTTQDTTAPSAPTSVSATAGFTTITLAWTNPTASDLAFVEVYENTTNNSGTASKIATVRAASAAAGMFTRSALANGVTRYYWLKAVDTSGNASAFTTVASTTTATIAASDFDATAPAVPTGLGLASALTVDTDGTQIITLTATWTGVADSDLAHYEVALQEASGSFVEFNAGLGLSFTWPVKANVSYTAKVRAVDKTGNRSAYTSTVSHTSTRDTTAPSAPSSVTATASFNGIFLSWTNPTATDLSIIEIYENSANNSGTATKIATVRGQSAAAGSYARVGLATGTLRYYFLKAVDTSGNASAFSTVASATTATLAATDFASGIQPVLYDDYGVAGASLPSVGNYEGRLAFNTNAADRKLYRYASGAWTKAVDGADISAGSITANSIAGGTITAAQIATGTLTTNLLAVGDFTNAVPDPNIADVNTGSTEVFNEWWLPSATQVTAASLNLTVSSTYAVTLTNSLTEGRYGYSPIFAVEPGQEYWVSGYAQLGTSGSTVTGGVGIQWYASPTGTAIGTTYVSGTVTTTSYSAATALPGWGFARASGGYAQKIDGTLVWFASGEPRITDRGLLIEGAITNLLLYSQEFDNAAWTKTDTTVTANAIAAPDDTTTADALLETATTAAHRISQSATVTASVFTYTVYLKGNGRQWAVLNTDMGFAATGGFGGSATWFDLTNGVVGTQTNVIKASIQACKNGWYRCRITVNPAIAGTANLRVHVAQADGDSSAYLGDITKGVYIWGAQLENNWHLSSYIPTTSATAARVADQAFLSGASWTAIRGASEHTLYGEGTSDSDYDFGGYSNTSPLTLVALGNGLTSQATLGRDDTGSRTFMPSGYIRDTSSSVALQGTTGATNNLAPAGQTVRLALALKAADYALVASGVVCENTLTGTTFPVSTTLNFGSQFLSSRHWSGYVERVIYRPRRTSNTDLIALTSGKSMPGESGELFVDFKQGVYLYHSAGSLSSSTRYTGRVTAPSKAVAGRVVFTRSAGGDRDVSFAEPIVRKAQTGQMIVDGAIVTAHMTANTINGDRITAGSLYANKLFVSGNSTQDALPTGITVGVSGTTIGTIDTRASDPVTRANTQSTQLLPGLVQISGATTLANWRNGTDTTKIEGGSIAANTILANSLTIGQRGLDIVGLEFQHNHNGTTATTNAISWTAGTIAYVNDSGVTTTASITAGNAAWTTGTLYIYWTKGGTTLSTTTTLATAQTGNTVILATYQGGTNLVANYGRTYVDGSKITTGTITASQIAAGTITSTQIAADTITAAQLQVGLDQKLLLLDGGAESGTVTNWSQVYNGGAGTFTFTAAQDQVYNGSYAFKISRSADTKQLGMSPRQMAVSDGKTYTLKFAMKAATTGVGVLSIYMAERTTPASTGYISIAALGGVTGYHTSQILVQIAPTTGWVLYEYTYTPTAGTKWAAPVWYNPMTGGALDVWIDDIVFEEQATGTMIKNGVIVTNHMTANTINGDRITAGTIYANKLFVSGNATQDALPTGITVGVSGTTIGTVDTRASDPVTRANTQSTQLLPGLVQISGSTTLSDWRQGGDTTKIAGGQISANTVSANKVNVGLRGLDMAGLEFQHNWNGSAVTTNTLAWSAGTISYVNDSGTATTAVITAGTVAWTTGTVYVYWVQGATTLSTTTTQSTAYAANNVVLATYRGGTDLVATYGRTIIDGSKITTNSITANQIAANTISADKLLVGVRAGAGNNLIDNAGLEDGSLTSTWLTVASVGSGATVAASTSGARTGAYSLRFLPANSSSGAFVGHKVVPVVPGRKYTISFWYRGNSATADGMFAYIASRATMPTGQTIPVIDGTTAIGSAAATGYSNRTVAINDGALTGTYQQYTTTWTCPSGDYYANIVVGISLTANTILYTDDFEFIEQATGTMIEDGVITSTKINVTSLDAISATVGTITATGFKVSDGTTGQQIFSVANGLVSIGSAYVAALRSGAIITVGSGSGVKVALQSFKVTAQDGDTLTWPVDLGNVPTYVTPIPTSNLVALSAGETYDCRLTNITSTSATAYLKKISGGTASNYSRPSAGVGTLVSGRWEIAKTDAADSSTSTYNFRVKGTHGYQRSTDSKTGTITWQGCELETWFYNGTTWTVGPTVTVYGTPPGSPVDGTIYTVNYDATFAVEWSSALGASGKFGVKLSSSGGYSMNSYFNGSDGNGTNENTITEFTKVTWTGASSAPTIVTAASSGSVYNATITIVPQNV